MESCTELPLLGEGPPVQILLGVSPNDLELAHSVRACTRKIGVLYFPENYMSINLTLQCAHPGIQSICGDA
jgi:hypothetical protein